MDDTTTHAQDSAELAQSYGRAEKAGKAFMAAIEAAMPLYLELMEARKERNALKDQMRTKYQMSKPQE